MNLNSGHARRPLLLAMAVASCNLLEDSIFAQPWNFARVADYSTSIPGGTGTFGHLAFSAPAISEGRIAFVGQNQTGVWEGVYSWSAPSLSVVANIGASAPGGGTFSAFPFFYSPALSAGVAVFPAGTTAGSVLAYGSPGAFQAVLTTSWTIPGTALTVASVGGAALDQNTVAFPAFASNPAIGGIYRWEGGTISVVADHTTPIPGGSGLFNNFGETDIHSGIVAVAGRGVGGQSGVYLGHPSGTLERRYDTNTPVPGGGAFTTFSDLSTEAGRVAFRGISPGFVGVYTDVSGTLEQLVRSGDPVPGVPGGVFSEFSGLALDSGFLVFGGSFGGAFLGSGIFTDYGGTLSKVIATGDPLDGRVVDSIVFSRESHSGNQIAFAVLFTDGWRGVYMATIPTPGTLALATGAMALGAARRRRPAPVRSARG